MTALEGGAMLAEWRLPEASYLIIQKHWSEHTEDEDFEYV